MAKSKPTGRDYPLSPTPEPQQTGGGTYLAASNGNLVRTYPIIKDIVELQSMDTTGYAKGKQNFELKTSKPNQSVTSEKVSRKDVPTVINKLKQGATNIVDTRTDKQKNKK